MKDLEGKVRACIDKYNMIEDGDHIAVGVSGGKDSMYLLNVLNSLKAYYPKQFRLTAITVDPCFNGKDTDYSAVKEYCADQGIPYIIRKTNLGTIIFEDNKEKNPCSLCARMRRGILHNICNENGINKLALGHHLDDAAQTVLMNLFYGGKLGCFSPVTYLSRKDIYMIRPLLFCEDHEIRKLVARKGLPVVKSLCPVDGSTKRAETEQLIDNLKKDFPDIKAKIIGAIQRSGLDGW